MTVAVVVAVVVLGALYVSWTANRLDRLHARVDAAWHALEVQLLRRAAAARALAAALPPTAQTRAVEVAARAALRAGPVAREAVENDLTRALREVLPQVFATAAPAPTPLVAELVTASRRVRLARSFHNAAVADARVVRRRRLVRALHLAGHRVLPLHFDIDEDLGEDSAGHLGEHLAADLAEDLPAAGDPDLPGHRDGVPASPPPSPPPFGSPSLRRAGGHRTSRR